MIVAKFKDIGSVLVVDTNNGESWEDVHTVCINEPNMGIPLEVGEYTLIDAYVLLDTYEVHDEVYLSYTKGTDDPWIVVDESDEEAMITNGSDIRRILSIPTHGLLEDFSIPLRRVIINEISTTMSIPVTSVTNEFKEEYSYTVYGVVYDPESLNASLIEIARESTPDSEWGIELNTSTEMLVNNKIDYIDYTVTDLYIIELSYKGHNLPVLVKKDIGDGFYALAKLYELPSIMIPRISRVLEPSDEYGDIECMTLATSIFVEYRKLRNMLDGNKRTLEQAIHSKLVDWE